MLQEYINVFRHQEIEVAYDKALSEDDTDIETIKELNRKMKQLSSISTQNTSINTIIISREFLKSKIELFITNYYDSFKRTLAKNEDFDGIVSLRNFKDNLIKVLEEFNIDSFLLLKERRESIVLKYIKLIHKLDYGNQSCKNSIIMNGNFDGTEVKVKLTKNEEALRREFYIMQKLYRKAKDSFIQPYEFFCGYKHEIICCDGSNDNLLSYSAFIMEKGIMDLCEYSIKNSMESDFLLEFRRIGYHISEILKVLHSNGIIWMDLKPANIVKYNENNGNNRHKAIDFGSCIELEKYTDSMHYSIEGTPRYISPEVAKVLLKSDKGNFKPSTGIDIFSFALWVFEVYNKQISLWECLGIDVTDDADILQCATQLTDTKIKEIIEAKLCSENSTAARHWLVDALKVHPEDRLSIEQLNEKHTLFTTKYATLNMDNLATKTDCNNTIQAVHKSTKIIKNIIRNEFNKLKQTFSIAITRIAIENKKCIDGLSELNNELKLQKLQRRLDVDIIQNLVKNLNAEISLTVSSSLSTILPTTTVDKEISADVLQKLDKLIRMITQVQDTVDDLNKNINNIKLLTSSLVKKNKRCPHSFVLLPKPRIDDSIQASKAWNYITNKVINPMKTLFWEESVLIFICPISMKQVKCGPNDKGYDIKLPTNGMKKIASIMKWGLFFLKIALATQGLAASIPDVSSFFPIIDDNYFNGIVTELSTMSETIMNYEDNVNQMMDSLTDEQDQAAFNEILDFLMIKESYTGPNPQDWEPKNTGLIKVVSDCDGSCMWVSQESKQEFIEKGIEAIHKGGSVGTVS